MYLRTCESFMFANHKKMNELEINNLLFQYHMFNSCLRIVKILPNRKRKKTVAGDTSSTNGLSCIL
jgi:hypothetical protein